ncbi:fungal pheromone STE3G-protein-coupled receptor [Schizopora paradoxa]|uniref:Fungal pheromone STE3G-protein-coupled receptor n=1 Tax=Schizopora paradoxa TaxID=27342 RepID=A0A0H2RPQ4_9AGAM|nr:fungal pheromone STE3G-protein-coupled receptor [Schizopora paradoxa]
MYALTPYPITPIGAFLGFVLAIAPLPLKLARRNHGLYMYGVWIAAFNLQMFVNSVIWHDNTRVTAKVWCDIVTKIQIGAGYGVRGCSLAICIRLYRITRMRVGAIRFQRGSCSFMTQLCIFLCQGVIIQPIRFNILEEYGCQATSFSYVFYPIAIVPQFIMSVASAVLAGLILRALLAHRREMVEQPASNSAIKPFQFKRLILIACLDTIFNFPIMIVGGIVQNALMGSKGGSSQPYVSWSNVHDGTSSWLAGETLSTITQTPASSWSMNKWTVLNLKWNEWIYVAQAILYFAVVGTTPEMGHFLRRVFCLSRNRYSDDGGDSEGGRKTLSSVIFRSSNST